MNPQEIYILIGCEESQAICLSFRALGFQAYSCDLKECSGGYPEFHIQEDVKRAIFYGVPGSVYKKWDAVILHPVCKYMAVSGLHRNIGNSIRANETEKSLKFVCDLLNLSIGQDIKHICIENPVSCISTRIYYDTSTAQYKVIPFEYKGKWHFKSFKATQTIQPYQFGEDASKRTCFWLIGYPKLKHTERLFGRIVDGVERFSNQTDSGQNKLAPSANRDALRSKTYPGIAKAIAKQWGDYLINYLDQTLF